MGGLPTKRQLRVLLLLALALGLFAVLTLRRRMVDPVAPPAVASVSASSSAREADRVPGVKRARGRGKQGPEPEPEMELEGQGIVLMGRVLHAITGDPVADVRVQQNGSWRKRTEPVYTDAEGRFRIDALTPGRVHPSARKEGLLGFLPAAIWISEPTTEITILVHPVASLRARIELAGSHAPCPKGVVHLRSPVLDVVEAIADERGNAVFPGLMPGTYEVELSCPDHARGTTADPIVVGDAPILRTFEVKEELHIDGVVVDDEGRPADDGVSVSAVLEGASPDESPSTWSLDQAGRFTIWNLQPGTYVVSARAWSGPVHVAPVTVVVAKDAPAPDVRLVRQARHTLQGHVIDEQGKPLAGAEIGVEQADGSYLGHGLGDDGAFSFDELAPGEARLRVSFASLKLEVRRNARVTVPADGPITVVAARPSSRIRGRVLRGAEPVARAEVRFICDTQDVFVDIVATDARGQFEAVVPEGVDCAVRATSDHGERARAEHVRAGANLELRFQAPGIVTGTIKNPPKVFRVWLSGSGHEEVFFGTGGHWEIRDVPPGENEVEVKAEGVGARSKLVVPPGGTVHVDLTLTPGGDQEPEEE